MHAPGANGQARVGPGKKRVLGKDWLEGLRLGRRMETQGQKRKIRNVMGRGKKETKG